MQYVKAMNIRLEDYDLGEIVTAYLDKKAKVMKAVSMQMELVENI